MEGIKWEGGREQSRSEICGAQEQSSGRFRFPPAQCEGLP